MSTSERESNPPGDDDEASRKRDKALDNTLPDGGPDLPAEGRDKAEDEAEDEAQDKAEDNAEDNAEAKKADGADAAVKPQLKRTMMGIDPGAAAKLKELAAAADAARAAAQARRAAAKKAKAEEVAVGPENDDEESSAAGDEEEDAFEASTALVDPQTQKGLLEQAAKTGRDQADGDESDDDVDPEGRDEGDAQGDAEDDAEDDAKDGAKDDAKDDAEADAGEDEDDEEDDEGDESQGVEEAEEKDEEDDEEDDDVPVEDTPLWVRYYGRTNVGLIREHNEDNFTIVDVGEDVRDVEEAPRATPIGPQGAVFAVCDGMGGAAAGEVASQMAVDTVYEYFSAMGVPKSRDHFAQRVTTAIEEAGNRIFSAAKMDRTRRGMGTTATVAGLIDKMLFVGQVGDSRAYVLRGGELGLITKDQSLVNQLIEAGQLTEEEAEAFEHSNIILQALGTTEEVTVDLTFLELRRGDRLMLCSDGLSGLVHPEMIKDVLSETADLVECCDKLIEMANAGGGHDNITVVCADFDGEDLAEPESNAKPMYMQYPLPPGLEEERESLVPHEPQMKAGGKKPGADVKRASDDTPPGRPHARGDRQPAPFNWGLILGALILAAIVMTIYLATRSEEAPEDRGDTPSTSIRPPVDEPETTAVDDDVEVRITTDIDGELFIDGDRFGAIADGDSLLVMLPPGAYRFEAMSGDDIVAEEVVIVNAGEPVDLALTLPSGAVGVDEVGGEEEEVEAAPEGNRAGPAEPREDDSDDGEPAPTGGSASEMNGAGTEGPGEPL